MGEWSVCSYAKESVEWVACVRGGACYSIEVTPNLFYLTALCQMDDSLSLLVAAPATVGGGFGVDGASKEGSV